MTVDSGSDIQVLDPFGFGAAFVKQVESNTVDQLLIPDVLVEDGLGLD